MITVTDVDKAYRERVVLSNVSLSLSVGQRCALVGANGCGKSTLLKILAGRIELDSGKVERLKNCQIGYFPQELEIDQLDQSIDVYLKRVTGIDKLEQEMILLESALDNPVKAKRYSEAQQEYVQLNGYEFDHQMKAVLGGFGFENKDDIRPIKQLSGGQRAKVVLAGILLGGANVLLLDEPTNNLDLPAIVWLESFLAQTRAAYLIVSHDRLFLDRLVNKIYEIEWFERKLVEYKGSYSSYIDFKMKKMGKEWEQYSQKQREIERLKESARTKKQWAEAGHHQATKDHDKLIRGARRDRSSRVAKQAKGIEQHIHQIKVSQPIQERKTLTIPLQTKADSTPQIIELKEVVAGYGEQFQIGPINLYVGYGKRIAIIGPNGAGKTTILRTIMGDLKPISGLVNVGSSLVLGNLAQSQDELPLTSEVGRFLTNQTNISQQEIYDLLYRFHLKADDISRKLADLSPGERSRLVLALFSKMSVNGLILDEPTNHLDIDALNALEHVLESYQGTVIFVSHDRSFLETVRADSIYKLMDTKLKEINDLKLYLQKLTAQARQL